MTGALLGAAPPLMTSAFLMDYYLSGCDCRCDEGLGNMAEVRLRNMVKRYDEVGGRARHRSRYCRSRIRGPRSDHLAVCKSTTLRMIAGLARISPVATS